LWNWNFDMKLVVSLSAASGMSRKQVGGKAWALAQWQARGARIPDGVVVTTAAYERFVAETALTDRLYMELGRKDFARMRWEELWDAALRIRNLFLKQAFPAALERQLSGAFPQTLLDSPLAVRSSAPEEDGGRSSFAGLHESFVNVCGWPALQQSLKLVWASLWSDRALLYRQELGLGVEQSRMAVLVQALVAGDRSGVVFSRSPDAVGEALIEAVWGLNQGLVDGSVEPDRWRLDRSSGEVVEHRAPSRRYCLVADRDTLQRRSLPDFLKHLPPLDSEALRRVWRLACTAEEVFGSPQDVEWTMDRLQVWALQARPITGLRGAGDDERGWYLSLRRSADQLEALRSGLENRLLPAMSRRADYWQRRLRTSLSARELAMALETLCREIRRWRQAYRQWCIPMAHGMRLFGTFFNDAVKPEDPFAFLPMLSEGDVLLSTQRNRSMLELAKRLRQIPEIAARLKNGQDIPDSHPLAKALEDFDACWGGLLWAGQAAGQRRRSLVRLLSQLCDKAGAEGRQEAMNVDDFLQKVPAGRRALAVRLLEIARASYRLRDDDNIFIGRLEACLKQAVFDGRMRFGEVAEPLLHRALRLAESLMEKKPPVTPQRESPDPWGAVKARQMIGQPAGPGLARGKARVVKGSADIADFQSDEILVCDAIDPSMTVVAPLAAGIVERRGGMLIHGAIIAREYGLPCVTGVPDATALIGTGDLLTVDGYLGIVIRHSGQEKSVFRAG
jgi:pyruvate,water dikinase